jgi:hypothetical protein
MGSSTWKAAYLEVLQESDKTKLAELVYVAEGAMSVRMGQLTDSAENQNERSEIKKASEDLLSIQIRGPRLARFSVAKNSPDFSD